VDISAGATLTIPDTGRRYVSVMIVNQDHYVNHVFHEPGEHELTVEQFGTPYVVAAARMLVDPADPGDVAAANALQDQLGLKAGSALPFVPPDYDQASLDATRAALLDLAKGLHGFSHAFGAAPGPSPPSGQIQDDHHLVVRGPQASRPAEIVVQWVRVRIPATEARAAPRLQKRLVLAPALPGPFRDSTARVWLLLCWLLAQ